jgi:hypothetical protein
MWRIQFDTEPKKKMAYFLDQHKDRTLELEKILDDLQDYPRVRWLKFFGDGEASSFATDSGQQIRLAGKAFFKSKTLIITHFSFHV